MSELKYRVKIIEKKKKFIIFVNKQEISRKSFNRVDI